MMGSCFQEIYEVHRKLDLMSGRMVTLDEKVSKITDLMESNVRSSAGAGINAELRNSTDGYSKGSLADTCAVRDPFLRELLTSAVQEGEIRIEITSLLARLSNNSTNLKA